MKHTYDDLSVIRQKGESSDSCYKKNKERTCSLYVLSSYRNKSIDLHSKSIDWFLYDGNTGI